MTELEGATEAVVVRPGDTLIVRTKATNYATLRETVDQIRERLPEDVQVLVINCDQILVYRPGGAA